MANRMDVSQAYAEALANRESEEQSIEYNYVFQDIANQERIDNKREFSKRMETAYYCLSL